MAENFDINEWAVLMELAEDSTDPDELSRLAGSPYVEIREAVAWNSCTPVEILTRLLSDEDWQVRETAVLNPNTPMSSAEKMLGDENEFVRNAVESRKNSS